MQIAKPINTPRMIGPQAIAVGIANGRNVFKMCREETLHGNTESCAGRRTHQTHDRGLKQVDEHRSA